jgi:hypothetical protein
MKATGKGIWSPLKPKRLSRKEADHALHFATYIETPTDRPDGQWYEAFLFRDDGFTFFGLQEFVGPLRHHADMRALATKVVQDRALMKSLVTEVGDVKRIWKGR